MVLISIAQPIISNGKTANKYLAEKKLIEAKSIKPMVIIKNANNIIWWFLVNLFLKKPKLIMETITVTK